VISLITIHNPGRSTRVMPLHQRRPTASCLSYAAAGRQVKIIHRRVPSYSRLHAASSQQAHPRCTEWRSALPRGTGKQRLPSLPRHRSCRRPANIIWPDDLSRQTAAVESTYMGAVSIAMAELRPGNRRQTELTMQHVWDECTPDYSSEFLLESYSVWI
jgi:hypothetical protein